jgi:hypothetical protein
MRPEFLVTSAALTTTLLVACHGNSPARDHRSIVVPAPPRESRVIQGSSPVPASARASSEDAPEPAPAPKNAEPVRKDSPVNGAVPGVVSPRLAVITANTNPSPKGWSSDRRTAHLPLAIVDRSPRPTIVEDTASPDEDPLSDCLRLSQHDAGIPLALEIRNGTDRRLTVSVLLKVKFDNWRGPTPPIITDSFTLFAGETATLRKQFAISRSPSGPRPIEVVVTVNGWVPPLSASYLLHLVDPPADRGPDQ